MRKAGLFLLHFFVIGHILTSTTSVDSSRESTATLGMTMMMGSAAAAGAPGGGGGGDDGHDAEVRYTLNLNDCGSQLDFPEYCSFPFPGRLQAPEGLAPGPAARRDAVHAVAGAATRRQPAE